ncbi:hypothetical protein DL767_004337 [Monosporascus sp. MG133]|nr:hypothetical protein DL767_004337 [Monosporascus sp. MG133]
MYRVSQPENVERYRESERVYQLVAKLAYHGVNQSHTPRGTPASNLTISAPKQAESSPATDCVAPRHLEHIPAESERMVVDRAKECLEDIRTRLQGKRAGPLTDRVASVKGVNKESEEEHPATADDLIDNTHIGHTQAGGGGGRSSIEKSYTGTPSRDQHHAPNRKESHFTSGPATPCRPGRSHAPPNGPPRTPANTLRLPDHPTGPTTPCTAAPTRPTTPWWAAATYDQPAPQPPMDSFKLPARRPDAAAALRLAHARAASSAATGPVRVFGLRSGTGMGPGHPCRGRTEEQTSWCPTRPARARGVGRRLGEEMGTGSDGQGAGNGWKSANTNAYRD